VRGGSFGMPAVAVDGNDLEATFAGVEDAVARARAGGGPTYIEARTYRLWGHMMGDPEIYRTKDEVTAAWEREPIARLGARLRALGHSQATLDQLAAEADAVIAEAQAFAEASPALEPVDALEDVFHGRVV
jgi:pyruvate dehydrogenase E1 component alpha subunit